MITYFKTTLWMLLLVFCANALQAQNGNLKKANTFYEAMEYSKAIEFYKKALKKSKKNKDATAKIADCYRLTSNYAKAAYWYEKATKLDEDNAELKYYYGQALMSNKEYEKAQWAFQEYAHLNPSDSRAIRYLEWCQNIDQYLVDSSEYIIEVAKFNSKESDFGPSFYNEGIAFASARPTSSIDRQDGWTGESYLDIFTAANTSGEWSMAEEIVGKSKSKFHEGPACFSQNFTKMYFTRNVMGKGKSGKIALLKIFESRLRNNEWVDPQELSFNSKNNEFSVGHPSISQDDKTLYFTSDMAGGYGGKDLYMVKKRNGSWGTPQNLGPEINTEGDEMFPFIHPDGTLYFASNGHGGFGGLDVFASSKDGKIWSKTENLGYPINSAQDDFGLILSENKQEGFIASNRQGGNGSDDIYLVAITENKASELINPVLASAAPTTSKSTKATYTPTASKATKTRPSSISAPSLSFYDNVTVTSVATKEGEDDLFYLVGILLDYKTKEKIPYKQVVLEELYEEGEEYVAYDKTDKIGNFYFELEPNKSYIVFFENEDGLVGDIREFNTKGKTESQIFHAILETNKPQELVFDAQDRYNELHGEPPVNRENEGGGVVDFEFKKSDITGGFEEMPSPPKKKVVPVPEPKKPLNDRTFDEPVQPKYVDVSTTNTVPQVTFKVQIGSFKRNLYPSHSFFKNVDGKYETEISPAGNNRYLVGNYTDFNNASAYQKYLKTQGYTDAIIVVYVNGRRDARGINQIPIEWKK